MHRMAFASRNGCVDVGSHSLLHGWRQQPHVSHRHAAASFEGKKKKKENPAVCEAESDEERRQEVRREM